MMVFVRQEDWEPIYGPELPEECHEGWYSHTWLLSIEEGQISMSTKDGCDLCSNGVGAHVLAEGLIEMEPIEVKLEHHYEGGGYYGDDHYWWWEAVHGDSQPKDAG